jgi:Amidase
MNDNAAPSSAGVLELLRRFKDDPALADRYAANCLEAARAAEPVLKAFEYLPLDVTRRPGPLSGIPVAIKDIIATSDMPTTNGSPIYRDHIPARDAWVVERLRNLGATIFGKTVSTEFAWRHPGTDDQSMEFETYAGRLVIGFGRGRRGRHRSARARHPDAGFGDPARGLQWRGWPEAELRRDPAHGRASFGPFARSRRIFCAPGRRRGVCAVADDSHERPRSSRPAASTLSDQCRSRRASAGKAPPSRHQVRAVVTRRG